MSSSMHPLQVWQYKLSFDVKIRNAFGTAFQDFFSTVMETIHGDDFVRVRPFGSLGDKGCDGYLTSKGHVFQCYGKQEDSPVNVAGIVTKLGEDYELAANHLKKIMKEWYFAHNLVNGLPTHAVEKIEQMKIDFPQHKFGTMGPSGLEAQLLKLSEDKLFNLLGPAATAADSRNMRMTEVRDLVSSLIASIDAGPIGNKEIKPVPAGKLIFNKLPQHWVGLLTLATQNAPYVRQYFERHPAPETGETIARAFSSRYKELKLENLAPNEIMDCLYEKITGVGSVSAQRQVAAHALLAYLFDACDIFEDHPSKVTP